MKRHIFGSVAILASLLVILSCKTSPNATNPKKVANKTEKVKIAKTYGNNLTGYGVTAGDFDNDGDEDLAVADVKGVRLLENTGNGNFVNKGIIAKTYGNNLTGYGIASGDIDEDGDIDLIVADERSVRVIKNPSGGNFLAK